MTKTNARLSPLKTDPSRTGLLRRRFEAEITRRFNVLRRKIVQLVVDEDSFGLAKARPFNSGLAMNERWQFMMDSGKLSAFQSWMAAEMQDVITSDPTTTADDWWAKYVQEGYRKGAGRAFDDVRKPVLSEKPDFYQGTRQEFLQSAFGRPEHIEKVKLLASRVFTDLQNVTKDLETKMTRVLVDGLSQGLNPRDIARNLLKTTDLSKTRAKTIARTEIIRAHAEGQLDSLERLGVEEVGVMVEWSTAGDRRVCPLCVPLDGTVLKISEARGIIPRHPNCRCTWIPANVGEKKAKQKRGPVQVAGARNDSIQAENPNAPLDQLKKTTRWVGADVKISGTRPVSILDKATKDAAAAKKAAKERKLAKEIAAKQAEEAAALAEAQAAAKAAKEAAKAAAIAAKEAAEKAAKEAAEQAIRASAIAREQAGELPELIDLEKVRSLPGSTRPDLMKNQYTGKQWVMKSTQAGIKPDRLRSEALADNLYRTLGIDVPKSGIVTTAEGPVKLSEFLDGGVTLQDWLAKATAKEADAMYAKISENFVADALMANHDVVGLSYDNILVYKGTPYRIDNGGALTYRAQGGAKQNFGAVVQELESMRNPSINSQTARVFKSLSDADIDEQIAKLLPKRDAFLAAIDDDALRQTMAMRFDNLAGRIAARAPVPVKTTTKTVGGRKLGKTAAERAKLRQVEYGISKDSAERVIQSRANGVTFAGDRELIEDGNILIWQETNPQGKLVTRVHLKVTPKGNDAIESALGDAFKAAVSESRGSALVGPSDQHWDNVLAGAKTIGKHASDGAYNVSTLQQLDSQHDYIQTRLQLLGAKTIQASDDELAMLQYYDDVINKLLEAKEAGKVPPTVQPFSQFKAASAKSKPVGPRGIDVRAANAEYETAEIVNGRVARKTTEVNRIQDSEYFRIDLGDGSDIRFHPASDNRSRTKGLALQGTVDITIPEQVTTKSLESAMAKLKTMGIDPTPPTPEFEELLYLHRSVYLRNDHTKAGYANIYNNTSLSDGEKVKQIKEWAAKEYNVDFAKLPNYNPAGVTKTGFGDGYRHWERWDLSAADLEKKLPEGTFLSHSPSAQVDEVIHKMLQSGGEATPTVDRIRKGVHVGSTGGLSSDSDIRTGGASYFFTRVSKDFENAGSIRFKPSALLRQDAVSYDGDFYGAIDRFDLRKATPEQYRLLATRYSNNETIFKHGLSILDDLDHIKVRSESKRAEVIEAFKTNKVTHLNDGRAVEDIVVTDKSQLKAPPK